MFLDGVLIGKSEQPLYAAARWLLANGAAEPGDTVATYRGGTYCMSGLVGHLAGLTVEETKHGSPSLRLARYRPFSTGAVAARTGETPDPGMEAAAGPDPGLARRALALLSLENLEHDDGR
jgi:hypothetical protein